MATREKFRISSHLKDIIGRDLVTNEFVAIFELVKNGFDAGATRVEIEFDPEDRTIKILDNGRGMSADDIRKKWLFVAYSEKASTNPSTYRDQISPAGQYAGNKGIGRFACDTLGSQLELYSRTSQSSTISKLSVDWTLFEADSREEFQTIDVQLGSVRNFPKLVNPQSLDDSGTIIVIKGPRHKWDADHLRRLRRDLAKLIDPFGTTDDVTVSTWLVDGSSVIIEGVDGPVGNDIADLLREKTSRIEVDIFEGLIRTELFDRGRRIYEVREPSPYRELDGCRVKGSIYFLNRSAKHTFTLRMGVRPVSFGSVFLFLNGFRVFPIGEETDDTLGLARRKQQGTSRYLGTRDVLGRVDVTARPKLFREVSSRDAGLIDDARTRALYDAIRKSMVYRLERYVVGVNWQDQYDNDRDTAEGLSNDDARGRILQVIGSLSNTRGVEIVYFDDEIVRVADDPDRVTDTMLAAMSSVAESRGDSTLLSQVEQARARVEALKAEREDARRDARRALEERRVADARIATLEKQAAFLGSSSDVNVERVQLLMHQASIHLNHVRSAVENASIEARRSLSLTKSVDEIEDVEDINSLLASIRQSIRRTSVSLASATLSSDRMRTVLSFAPNIRVDLETDRVNGDLAVFLREYFSVRLPGVSNIPKTHLVENGISFEMEFSPVDIAVMIDNLLDNSQKAKAENVTFKLSRRSSTALVIHVSDDGLGLDSDRVDKSKIFERGYSGTANGTGLGLYSIRQIVDGMRGSIRIVGDGHRADFEIILPGVVS